MLAKVIHLKQNGWIQLKKRWFNYFQEKEISKSVNLCTQKKTHNLNTVKYIYTKFYETLCLEYIFKSILDKNAVYSDNDVVLNF